MSREARGPRDPVSPAGAPRRSAPAATGVGERLARERRARGLTLQQIADSTKIGLRYLEALESEHFDRLPGGVFARGYVRAYASAVGLDPEATVEKYLAHRPAADAPDDDATLDALRSAFAGRPKRARRRTAPRVALMAVVLCAVGAAVSWFATRQDDARQAPDGIEARVVIDRPVSGTLNCDDRRVEVLDDLRAGTTLELGCGKFLIVTADDGGALRIGVDGAPPVPPAADGEPVLGLRFKS